MSPDPTGPAPEADVAILERADMVEPMCWAALAAVLVSTAGTVSFVGASVSTFVTLVLTVPIMAAIWLSRRGRVRAGAWLMALSAYSLITTAAAWFAPVLDVVHLYAIATMMAGLVLGVEAMLVLSLLGVASTITLVLAEAQGWLLAPEYEGGLITPLAALITGLLLAGWMVSRALASIRRARTGWQATTAELQTVLANLEATVEERTVALRQVNAKLHDEIQIRNLIQADLLDARDDAEAAAEAKTQFVANVSHEIRTPLNGILGTADLLAQEPLPGALRRQVETIRTCGELMVGLVDDVLNFSQLDAGEIQLQHVEFNLASVLEASLVSLRVSAARRGIVLAARIGEQIPQRVRGDPKRLSQIVSKLVGNAVKFTVEGRVDVEAERIGANGGSVEVRLRVRDTGVGMSPEAAARVFEPFVQADSATTRAYGGTGIGLTIAKQLVEQMGGHLSLTTELGAGATFEFVLRFALADAPLSDEARATKSPAETRSALNVLVVEDNPINMQVACAMLERLGHDASAAVDGASAIEVLAKQSFDLVLLDCQMPGVDGLEVARTIRGRPGPNRATPMIAVTAYDTPDQRERVRLAGINGFVPKPLRLDTLAETLGETPSGVDVASPDASSARVLDKAGLLDPGPLAQLQQLEAVRPGMLAKMAKLFLEQAELRLATMVRELAAGDRQATADAAHALKGSSYTIGATQIGAICAEIESQGRADQDPRELVVALRHALAAVRPTLEALGQPAPAPSARPGQHAPHDGS